jgi:hypothetical protein
MILKLDGVAERCDDGTGPRWKITFDFREWFVGLDKVNQADKNRNQGHYCNYHGAVLSLDWDTRKKQFTKVDFDVVDREPIYELSEIVWMSQKGYGTALRSECGCKLFVSSSQVTTEGPPLAPGIEIWHTTGLHEGKVQAMGVEICLPRVRV